MESVGGYALVHNKQVASKQLTLKCKSCGPYRLDAWEITSGISTKRILVFSLDHLRALTSVQTLSVARRIPLVQSTADFS